MNNGIMVSLEIFDDAREIEQVFSRHGIIDPELSPEKILTELAAKILSGKSVTMARYELLMEMSFRSGLGFSFPELETLLDKFGGRMANDIEAFEFEFPSTERKWRIAHRDIRMLHLRCET